jgi:creatinine amidohydrolase/Fe(II)-dependent formamide hydrolase-like protein
LPAWSIVISGHSQDFEAEKPIREAARSFVRAIQAHTDTAANHADISVAQFDGSHGGAVNLFNPSDAEQDEYTRQEIEEEKKRKEAAEEAPVAEVGFRWDKVPIQPPTNASEPEVPADENAEEVPAQ